MRGLYQWRGMQTVPDAKEQDVYERYTWRALTRRTAQGQWVIDLSSIDQAAERARQQRQKFAFRVQAVADGGKADAVLAGAPDREGDYFGVPKVVE